MAELEVLDADQVRALGAARRAAVARSGEVFDVPHHDVLGDRDGPLAQLENAALRLVLGTVSRLPDSARRACTGAAARLAYLLDRRHDRAARTWLRQAFGPGASPAEIEERVLQSWRHLFSMTVDSERLERLARRSDPLAHFRVELCPGARELLASGAGFLLVMAHLGNWEAGAFGIRALGVDLVTVTKPPRNRPLSVALQRQREARGLFILPRRGAMKYAPRVVACGRALSLMLDQRARARPVIAPFFGRPARCDRSAGVLVRRLRAPVLFAFCEVCQEPPRFRLRLPALWRPEDLAGQGPERIAGRINAELERMILARPDQFFWLHDRYKDTPESFPEAGPGERREAGDAPERDRPAPTREPA